MATVTFQHATRIYPGQDQPAVGRARPRDRRRRVPRARRTLGMWQVDDAADARRARTDRRRRGADRRARRDDGAAEGPRHRDGVPVVRALSPHDRRREHRLPPEDHQGPQGRARPARARGGPDPRPRRLPQPQAGEAVRRAAPAGGDGSRDRAPATGLPHGRAAVEPRRQAPRADPDADRRAAAPPRRHHRVRDPRPGRGDDDGRPRRRAARRCAAAVRDSTRAVHPPRQHLRRRLHRLAGDELADGRCRRCRCPLRVDVDPADAGAARRGHGRTGDGRRTPGELPGRGVRWARRDRRGRRGARVPSRTSTAPSAATTTSRSSLAPRV